MPESSEQENNGGELHPRPFWSGTIAFGLVSIPVTLMLANRSGGVPLHMIAEDGTPLVRRYFCSLDGKALDAEDIVRGYEVEKDRYVTIDDRELEALAPEMSQEIDLKRFVPRGQIDPIYFERAYFLIPERGAVKAYRLLARIMEESARAGIATFVMRGKEYLIAIIGERGLLRAETLRFHDELRGPMEVGLPAARMPEQALVKAMEQAMQALAADRLERPALIDEHREQLMSLIRRKLRSGRDVMAAPAPAESGEQEEAEAMDLMQMLKRSLQAEAQPRKPRPRPAASKTELYRKAKELGIEGRSHMSKEDLAEAIRRAR